MFRPGFALASLGTVLHHHVEEILSSRSMQEHGSSVGCRRLGDISRSRLQFGFIERASVYRYGRHGFGCCLEPPARRPWARASPMSRESKQRLMGLWSPMASSSSCQEMRGSVGRPSSMPLRGIPMGRGLKTSLGPWVLGSLGPSRSATEERTRAICQSNAEPQNEEL